MPPLRLAFFHTLLIGAVITLACPPGAARSARAADASGHDPLALAALVPADVSLFLEIDHAAALRLQAASRPVQAVLSSLLAEGPVREVWRQLADGAGLGEEAMFDALLGTRFALALRPDASTTGVPAPRQWVLITEVPNERLSAVLDRFRPRRLPPRHGIPVVLVPEHALVVAVLNRTAVIGPERDTGLLDETLQLLAGVATRPALAAGAEVARAGGLAATLEHPRVAVVARHAPPLGGWSVAVAESSGGAMRLKHAGDFESSPFTRPVPRRAWCPGSLGAIEADGLVTVVEPTEIGLPVQDFMEAMLAEPVLDREARRSVGTRQILFVGEVEGRLEADAVDVLIPTVAIALEIDGAPEESPALDRMLDRNVTRMGRAMERIGGGTFDLDVPRARDLIPGAARSIDLGPAAAWLAPGFPVLRGTSLNWTSVDGPHGRFWIIATHPQQLEATARALQRPADAPPVAERNWSSCGGVNGSRAATHLRSWAQNVEIIAPGTPDEGLAEFRGTVELLAVMCETVDRCHWTLARPTPRSMELDITLDVLCSSKSTP